MTELQDGRGSCGGPVDARPVEPGAVERLMDGIAWETIVALRRTLEAAEDKRATGWAFSSLWEGFGLDEVRFDNPTDAQRILQSAFDLALNFPEKTLTVEAAILDAGCSRPAVDDCLEKLSKWVPTPDESLDGLEPTTWLMQSVGYLAKAAAVRDAVASGAVMRVGGAGRRAARRLADAHPETGSDRAATRRNDKGFTLAMAVTAAGLGGAGVASGLMPSSATSIWATVSVVLAATLSLDSLSEREARARDVLETGAGQQVSQSASDSAPGPPSLVMS